MIISILVAINLTVTSFIFMWTFFKKERDIKAEEEIYRVIGCIAKKQAQISEKIDALCSPLK